MDEGTVVVVVVGCGGGACQRIRVCDFFEAWGWAGFGCLGLTQ